MAFKRFEDIIAWQQARSLASEILAMTNTLDTFKREPELSRKLQNVSLELQGVIARSFASKDPQRFLEGLKASQCYAEELRALLYIAADRECINLRIFERITRSIQACSRKTQDLISYIKRQLKSKSTSQSNPESAGQTTTGSFRKIVAKEQPVKQVEKSQTSLEESDELERVELVPSNDYSVLEDPPKWKPAL
ncbi:four helix bundle protein [bacterium]|nr:four helix bundle protein [bacterium]